jgi:hypothetical protein
MTTIVQVSDLPAAVQSNELVDAMVAAANSKATRVAPCLTTPTAAWAANTLYMPGQTVHLTGNEALQVSIPGTSGASEPAAPALDATVVDGTVTWLRIGPTPDVLAEAKLVLIGAISRWCQAGTGALTAQTVGPYSQTIDTRQRTGFNLWPSEITSLQDLCRRGDEGAAFSVDTAPRLTGAHLLWCSLNFGATYCSCGVDIAWYPIYETCE